jgi:hypothetical protein
MSLRTALSRNDVILITEAGSLLPEHIRKEWVVMPDLAQVVATEERKRVFDASMPDDGTNSNCMSLIPKNELGSESDFRKLA